MSLLSGYEHIVRENEPLAPFTRLNIGGSAEYFAEPTNEDELTELVQRFAEANHPIRLIGSGTNLLINDAGVKGLVIHLAAPDFCSIEVNENRITVGGGTRLSHFVATAVREGLAGPEQLVGLPGTIGGALHNNTDAHGVDIGTWVESAEVLTRAGERLKREKDSLSFSYRQSSLSELVILKAEFVLDREPAENLTKAMQKLWIVRRSQQPSSELKAAYMFKDLGGELAGDLIDRAGLKGTRAGKVEVLDSDPNFFVAGAGATSEDVLSLLQTVQTQVSQRLDQTLEPAIQIW
ncbi:MAG: UDP-N-acetylmuramate dehydrogenase [Mariniblastus sp.]|nr:UDP-N-acetylmuramate dehydrogenase [Mariniblastus sp.]